MELEPKMIIEYGAYGVMLYLFIRIVIFMCKDLREDLGSITDQLKTNGDIIQQDTKNTSELKTVIGNHLIHAIDDLGNKVDKLGEKIDKKFPDS